MLPPTPLSLLCAILLCLPLAVIFTSTTTSSGGAATSASSPLPIPTSSTNQTKTNPDTIISPPPPKIKNQTVFINEDNDDMSLFKLASRVDPNPKPRKKVAFMFLTTTPLPFAPLWELFFTRAAKNLYNIYVHADPNLNYTSSFQGVFARRVVKSKPTRRHTPTLISAARRLLAHALLHDGSNSMFALLSPACIPIRSFNFTYSTLIKSRKSFIEILENEPGAYERWAARGEEVMSPEVEFEDFRIGSQFWVVKRKHARIIVRDRRLWSKFMLPCLDGDTCYPEEHYFPTLLSMVDSRGCVPCTLTHVDWKGGHGGHPRTYKANEVDPDLIRTLRNSRPRYGDEEFSDSNSTLQNSNLSSLRYGDEKSNSSNSTLRKRNDPFLFARKFSPGSLHQLMSIANEVIFKD